ncbi:MAG: hypothetical protein AAF514_11730 [Verrucomicrobiota bacterium]
MHSNAIAKIVVLAGGLLLSLILAIQIMGGSHVNSLAVFYKYLSWGAVVFGIMAPRPAFYVLVFLTIYLDFLKRLLVVAGDIGWMDLFYILGVAPMLLLGICVGVVFQFVMGQLRIRKPHMLLLLGVTVFFFANMIYMMQSGLGMKGLADLANQAAYAYVLFVMPVLFPRPEDLLKILKFAFLLFIPSAFYIFYQSYFGITSWERSYLLSGYTLELRQMASRVFRPFSTMNSAGLASVMYAIMAMIAFAPRKDEDEWKLSSYIKPSKLFWFLIFAAAAALTYSRGGWFCGIVAIMATLAFRTWLTTTVTYAAGIIGIGLMVVFADWMVKNNTMSKLTDMIVSDTASDSEVMAFSLGTFNSRLYSVQKTLSEPSRWTPFGAYFAGKQDRELDSHEHESEFYIHDGFSDMLITFGYVPLGLAMIFGAFIVFQAHRFYFSMPPSLERWLTLLSLAAVVGIAFGATANPAQLKAYPVNFYFYFFCSIPLSAAIFRKYVLAEEEVEEDEPEEAAVPRALLRL